MPPKQEVEDPDDTDGGLAPAATPEQIQELQALRYRGAWPSTSLQAAAILRRLHDAPTPRVEPEGQRPPA